MNINGESVKITPNKDKDNKDRRKNVKKDKEDRPMERMGKMALKENRKTRI